MVGLILWSLLIFQFYVTIAAPTTSFKDKWNDWGQWSTCSCGGGTMTRTRKCNSQSDLQLLTFCPGYPLGGLERQNCTGDPCPVWDDWEQWGTCSAACGYGKQTRTRRCKQCENPPRETECTTVGNNLCDGSHTDTETNSCTIPVCLGNLSQSLQLTCDLGNTYYRWEKPQSSQVNVKGSSQTLEIDSLQYHDAGNYSCRSYYKGDRHPIKVVVQGKPVMQTTANKTFQAGDTAILPCSVEANPAIYYVWWTKDVAQISSTTGYQGGTKDQPNLTISNVQTEHSGEYVCHARNSIGENSSTTNVVIRNLTTKAACENAKVSIPCLYESSNNATKVNWMKDDSDVLLPNDRMNGSTVSNPSLEIKKAQLDDSGLYQCNVINADGETHGDIIKLNVKALVSFAPTIPVIETTEGSNETLPCEFENCVQPFEVYWTKRHTNKRADDADIKRIPRPLFQPSLVIHSVNMNDSAVYTCHVTAGLRTFTGEDIILLVKAQPREHNSKTKDNNTAIVAVASSCGTLLSLVIIVGVVKKVKKQFSRSKLSVTVATNNAGNATHGSCEINPNVDETIHVYDERSKVYDNTEHVYDATNQNSKLVENIAVSNKGHQTSTDPSAINVYEEIVEN